MPARIQAMWIEIYDVSEVHETEKARLLKFEDGKEVWVPKRKHTYNDVDKIISIDEQTAIEKGLDVYC
jgi:hypothetical protein